MPLPDDLMRIEAWRTRFLRQGTEAIDAFLHEHPAADRSLLRSLVQEAVAMHHKSGTSRKLLRYLRQMDGARQDHAALVPPTVSPSINSDG